ncbi:hypothetical protein Hanom_Chr14g01298571 [Helianthus anomalus]
MASPNLRFISIFITTIIASCLIKYIVPATICSKNELCVSRNNEYQPHFES